MNLFVKVNKDIGVGGGKVGMPITSKQALQKAPIKVIEKIGSSYTGVGINKGHNVIYNLELKNDIGAYSKLDFDQSQTIAIVYTLTDN